MTTIKLPTALVIFGVSAMCVGVYQFRNHRQTHPYRDLEKYQSAYQYQPAARAASISQTNVEFQTTLEQIERGLASNPSDRGLLAKKVHLTIEYAPAVAVEACQKILKEEKDNHFALSHLAVGYMLLGDSDRAVLYAAKALATEDSADTRNIIGHIFYRRGDLDLALFHYRKALEFDPTNQAAQAAIQIVQSHLAERPHTVARGK